MPLSNYGRNLYADLIVGITSTAPSMWVVLCDVAVTDADDGSTIAEVSPRFLLVPGLGSWEQTEDGVRTYLGSTDYELPGEYDAWGIVNSYAIVDSLTPGTGNVLFYGSITPTNVIGPMIISFTDLVIEVPA